MSTSPSPRRWTRLNTVVSAEENHISYRNVCIYLFLLLLFALGFVYRFSFLFKEEYDIDQFKLLINHDSNHSVKQYPACPIPQLDPYDKAMMHLLDEKPPSVNCEEAYPLLFNSTLYSTIVPVKGRDFFRQKEIVSCHYRTVTRSRELDRPDDNVELSLEPYPLSLTNATVIPSDHEFIAIYCKFAGSANEKLMDVHAFVPLKEPKQQTSNGYSYLNLEGKRKWNVVILGLDSVSRMSFVRTMPKTLNFLKKELGAVEMLGYNKVADNTFPNIMPMLTSKTPSELKCTSGHIRMDECPFIWKKYSKEGYLTSIVEDAPDTAIFNLARRGFKQQPTDYYPRPMIRLAASYIASNHQKTSALCFGPRLTFQIMLDYVQKFVDRMSKINAPFFQFTWASALTHDRFDGGLLGDHLLLQSLQWLKQSGYLENTVFILISDHGHRSAKMRNTVQGALEDRLPALYLVLPKDFKKQYKLAYHNLVKNSDKLVTTFDLYETLEDILHPEKIEDSSLFRHEILRQLREYIFRPHRGISLFSPISEYRTCKKAGIEVNYCSCNFMKLASTTMPIVKKVAKSAVARINFLLSDSPNCKKLQLDEVTLAQHRGRPGYLSEAYQVNFQTRPGGGQFEAFLSRERKGAPWKVEGIVVRTNLYGNQSHCVADTSLKPYCYCSDI